MRVLAVLLALFIMPAKEQGEDSWTVILNGKNILNTKTEDEVKNLMRIPATSLKKNNIFIINYIEKVPVQGWERFMAAESQDTTLSEIKGRVLQMPNAALRNMFQKSDTIRVYTWALPTDLELRKRVRIRRVHLCTLVKEG